MADLFDLPPLPDSQAAKASVDVLELPARPGSEAATAKEAAVRERLKHWDMGMQMGASVPFAGDVAGLAHALPHAFSGKFGEKFQEGRDLQRATADKYAEENPWQSAAAKVLGFGVSGSPARGVAAPVAASLPQAMAQGAKTGAAIGGLYGAGDNSELGDTLGGRAISTGIGAAGGAVTGAAVPAAVEGGRQLWQNGVRPLYRPFTEAGRQEIAGKVLSEAAGGAPITPQAAPLPNMQLTPGQAANNPGMMWLERSVQQGSGQGENAAAAARTANNQAVRDAIGQVGDVAGASEAPAGMSSALEAARNTARAGTREAWKAAGVDAVGGIPTQPLTEAVNSHLDTLTRVERGYIPPHVKDALASLGPRESLKEIGSISSALGDAASAASRAGEGNKARVLGTLRQQVENFLDDPVVSQLDPAKRAAMDSAKAATREFHQTFTQPNAVRQALGVNSYGADILPVSQTADKFIKPASRGGAESWLGYLGALSKATPDVREQGLSAARSAFVSKMIDKAELAAQDHSGAGLLSASKLKDFVTEHQHIINSPAFTDAQRAILGKLTQAADMAARAAPQKGSDTFAKLAGDKFVDSLVGAWPARVVGGGLGAVAGHFTGTGPLGIAGGALVGEIGGDALARQLYKAPREKVLTILRDAMTDPALANALMMKARNGNAGFMAPGVRQYLATVLGAGAAPNLGRGLQPQSVPNGTNP